MKVELPELSQEAIDDAHEGYYEAAACEREAQFLTLLQSLADAGIEVKDGKVFNRPLLIAKEIYNGLSIPFCVAEAKRLPSLPTDSTKE